MCRGSEQKTLERASLSQYLNKNILNLLTKEHYEVCKISPLELLTFNRIDIVAKYLYIKFRLDYPYSYFWKELYLEHLKIFNYFVEADGSNKVGKEAFMQTFNQLIQDISKQGFKEKSIIPVAKDMSILDGSHRVAAAIYFKKPVFIVKTEIEPQNFNYTFFQVRGLENIYLDTMAMYYAKLKLNTFVILIWPIAGNKEEELENIIKSYGNIVYKKEVFLSENGLFNLVIETYKKEKWLGGVKDGFAGARNKARWCFNKDQPLRAYLFEAKNKDDLLVMKSRIRDLFGLGNHSVHINDTHSETLRLTELLFNDNSIHWLNFSRRREFKWFKKMFTHYRNWIQSNKLDKELFCVDGGSILAAYGIRETRDLDFLYAKDFIESGFREISCHNNEIIYYEKTKEELIFNPKNYFYFEGYKFISLENLKEMKKRRGERKDIEDIHLIDNLISDKKITPPLKQRVLKYFSLYYWKNKVKFYLLQVRFYVLKLKKKFSA